MNNEINKIAGECVREVIAGNRLEVEKRADERLNLPSASSMERRVNCPASHQAEAECPDLPDSPWTRDGQVIHAALEKGDDEGLKLDQKEIKKRLDLIESYLFESWCSDFSIPADKVITVREERMWIRQGGNEVASAKPDAVFIHKEFALVVDAKTGFLKTTASHRNWQIRTQAVAVWHEYRTVTHVRGAIAHGRLKQDATPVDYDLEQLRLSERELWWAVWRMNQPDPVFNPGSWCHYCRAKGTCKALAVQSLMPISGMPVAIDQLGVIERVKQMSPADVAFVYSRRQLAEWLFDAVKHRMKMMTTEQLQEFGYKLSKPVERRVVTDVAKAIAICEKLIGEADTAKCLKLTLGAVEEAVAVLHGVGKDKAKATVRDALAEVLETKLNEPSLREL